ncbi:MAG: hypothetical protein Q4A83_03045 [Bacillota bacterium]|nr:hypothetical protein [Bacillota bacterium]
MDLILSALDFDLVCIIFYVLAVLLGKKRKAPWVLFGIGAVVEALGFAAAFWVNNADTAIKESAGVNITGPALVLALILFAVFSVLTAWLISRRKAKVAEE